MNDSERRALWRIRHKLLAEATARAPREACGLLGMRSGWFGSRLRLYACENVAESPTDSFIIPPLQQVDVLEQIRHRGEEFWGVFHSHPHEGAGPSERDIEFATYLGAGLHWVIVGLEPGDGEPEVWANRLG